MRNIFSHFNYTNVPWKGVALVAIVIFFGSVAFWGFSPSEVHATGTGSIKLSGYAWSSNIGWISFSCKNNNSCSTSNYGVTEDTLGNLSGYAWSSNIGWISFNTADLAGCPSGSCSAKVVLSSGKVIGWARALAAPTAGNNAGGWSGWIQLNPAHTSGSNALSQKNGAWSGYAFGSSSNDTTGVIGWVDFNGGSYCVHIIGLSCSGMPPKANLSFKGSGSILLGQSATLNWSSTNTISCKSVGGFSTGGRTSGSVSVTPTNTSTYQITCSGLGGTVTANATITVLAPAIKIFTASPTRVRFGGFSTIKWDASNVKSCTVTGPGLSATGITGSQKVNNIIHQSTFTLSCKTPITPLIQSTIVNVVPKFKQY